MPVWRGPILQDRTWIITGTREEYKSYARSTKDTTYLALAGELWGVFCEYLWENWPRYNGIPLYFVLIRQGQLQLTCTYRSCQFQRKTFIRSDGCISGHPKWASLVLYEPQYRPCLFKYTTPPAHNKSRTWLQGLYLGYTCSCGCPSTLLGYKQQDH